jgi:hypothetical protein
LLLNDRFVFLNAELNGKQYVALAFVTRPRRMLSSDVSVNLAPPVLSLRNFRSGECLYPKANFLTFELIAAVNTKIADVMPFSKGKIVAVLN